MLKDEDLRIFAVLCAAFLAARKRVFDVGDDTCYTPEQGDEAEAEVATGADQPFAGSIVPDTPLQYARGGNVRNVKNGKGSLTMQQRLSGNEGAVLAPSLQLSFWPQPLVPDDLERQDALKEYQLVVDSISGLDRLIASGSVQYEDVASAHECWVEALRVLEDVYSVHHHLDGEAFAGSCHDN